MAFFVRGDGDGWIRCEQGHRHWGRYGAAGLLLCRGQDVLLQRRARWTHHGGTWGVVGGARNSGESALAAAAREAVEEAGVAAGSYTVLGEHVDDHGGWSYTTVVAVAHDGVAPVGRSAESIAVRWVPEDRFAGLRLHPGFAASWPTVRAVADAVGARVRPAADVEGSLPPGQQHS